MLPDFTSVFEVTPVASLVFGTDAPRWTVVAVNDAYVALEGTARASIVSRTLAELFPSGTGPRNASLLNAIGSVLERVVRTRQPETLPPLQRDLPPGADRAREAHERWWELTFRPVLAGDDRVAHVVQTVEDVSQRIHDAQDLDRARRGVANVLDRISEAFVHLDHDWRITFMNPAAAAINGRPAASAIGRTHWEEWPASVGTEVERQYRYAMALQRPVHFEHRYLEPGRHDRWLNIDAYPGPDGLSIFYRDITARKSAEREREVSDGRYRALITAAAQIVWIADPGGEFRQPQPDWASFTGQTFEEYREWGWVNAIHSDDRKAALALWQSSIATRVAIIKCDLRIRRRDGIYRAMAVRAVPVGDAIDDIREWVGMAADITYRRETAQALEAVNAQLDARNRQLVQQEVALQAANVELQAHAVQLRTSNAELTEAAHRYQIASEHLKAILIASPLAFVTARLDGVLLTWNPAAERMFGWTESEIVGRIPPYIPPERSGEFTDFLGRLVAGETLTDVNTRRRRKDGTFIDVRLSAGPLRDVTGTTVGILAMYADVSEQAATQAALASERAFLRQVIDTDPHFVFAKDRNGRFTLANQAVAAALGTTPTDLVGRTDADVNPNAEEVRAFRRVDLEVMNSLRSQEILEEPMTDAAGNRRWLHTVKRPLIGPDGVAHQILAVSTDITARKELEAQLLQAQKMEAIGRLAGGVAHDFNNILTVIRSYSEMLLEESVIQGTLREDVGEIRDAAERAAQLTRQLLAFSRKQVMRPATLDLNVVVSEMQVLITRLIGEDVKLELSLARDPWPVRADRGQIEQVIMNLAINGRDAMPNGGTMVIATANADVDGSDGALPPGGAPGPHVVLTVSDTGTGMDAATRAHIFEPFFTTKGPGKGTGLGLATVYGVVRQSGGGIAVDTEPGRGTTFTIYLPRDRGDADLQEPGPPVLTAISEGTTILLVEDDPAVRTVTRQLLERAGYIVVVGVDAEDALARVMKGEPKIDLVVTDAVMPGMGGVELARRLAASSPSLPVVLVSGYTEDALNRQGPIAPNTVFVEKPFTLESLTRAISAALGGVPILRDAPR
ncbi:MAG: hypothetical protein NVS1B4_14910 [Gemmatimonadaceae bacterium]